MDAPNTGDDRSHGFSVELKSKRHVKGFTLSQGGREGVLLEGDLGALEEMGFLEEAVLLVRGSHGTLRLDLTEDELKAMLAKRQEDKDRP